MAEEQKISGLDIMPINNENSHNSQGIARSQKVSNNNACRLKEIGKKDYSDFRQLMDIALKDFAWEEKAKYIDVFCKDDSAIYSDEFEAFQSSESSAALPYEIQFDGDDDFEQVLPNVVRKNGKVNNDYVLCSESFPELDLHSKPNFISIYKKQKTRLWTKLRRLLNRFNWKTTPSDPSKDTQTVSDGLRDDLYSGNVWQPLTSQESSSQSLIEGGKFFLYL